MADTVTTNVTYPGVQEWADANGIDPKDYSRHVTLEDDGTVTLHRFLRDSNGHLYLDPNTGKTAVAPVTITPEYPLPSWSDAG